MSLIVFASERFAEHQTPPGHPESPERAGIFDRAAGEWRRSGGAVAAPAPATAGQLGRVHDDEYLRRIAGTAGTAVALDADTYTSPETVDIARFAAGAAVSAVDHVMSGGHQRALVLARPPGHHAERGRAMGFCVYNNVAVAAAHARAAGAGRVAIVDYDVHHGNGTQHIFLADPSVLYVSVHQYPYYPGTGDAGEIGTGEGEGFTVNVPLEMGATDQDYRHVFSNVVVPVVRQFRPDIVLVSAGFDAHERDPLGGMRLTTGAFQAMTAELRNLADECCGGKLVAVTEGGYDLLALSDALTVVTAALAAEPAVPPEWPSTPFRSTRGAVGAGRTKAALGRFWTLTG